MTEDRKLYLGARADQARHDLFSAAALQGLLASKAMDKLVDIYEDEGSNGDVAAHMAEMKIAEIVCDIADAVIKQSEVIKQSDSR